MSTPKRGQPALDLSTPFKALIAATGGAHAAADMPAYSLATIIRLSAHNPKARFKPGRWKTLRPFVADLFARIEAATLRGDREPLDRLTAACMADFESAHGKEPMHPAGVALIDVACMAKLGWGKKLPISKSDFIEEQSKRKTPVDAKTVATWQKALGYDFTKAKPGPKTGSKHDPSMKKTAGIKQRKRAR